MTLPTPDNEPVSVWRVIEFVLAVAVLAVFAGAWVASGVLQAYSWLAALFSGG